MSEGKFMPLNLKTWIDDHRDLLKPPVGNKMVWKDREFIVMVVGGPNARKDYHINESEEFFYMVEGQMNLRVMDQGKPRDITIQEGEIYLLPPKIPHAPQRPANTVGLVIERKRQTNEKDGLRWYCEKCHEPLYEEFFTLKNIEKDMPPIFDRFYSSPENRTCKACKTIMEPPKKSK